MSAAASACVGVFNNGTMLPMAAVMAVCAIACCVAALLLPSRKPHETQDATSAAA